MTKRSNSRSAYIWAGIRKFFVYTGLYAATSLLVASTIMLDGTSSDRFPLLRAFIIFFATLTLTKYFFYMTLAPWHDVRTAYGMLKRKGRIARYRPLVSVIIPAWNEEVGLVSTVRTLLASTYRNLEIVVVNDGSTDDSDRIMRDFVAAYETETAGQRNAPRMVYHYKDNGGKGSALNTGIALSSGGIILTIDADCIVEPQTVGNFVRHFADPRVSAAVGNVKIGNTRTLLGVIQRLEFLFSFYFKKADSLMNAIYIIGGAAGAFRREVFDMVGMYSTTNITEDIELSVRIQDAGLKIVYASDAIVHTEGAVTLDGLKKQRLRWKRGRFQTFADYKHLFFSLRRRHNKLLTYFVLPLALVGDIQLFFELLFIAFLYFYSVLINDFSSFISGIIIVGFMFVVQIFFDDDAKTRNLSFYLLAPIGWMLFYLVSYVEYTALVRGLASHVRRQEISWQRWQRTGVIDS
jgi:cellulose synthase/poly-beta-1,6-N-acetylglucosamine synthase-like glycosyltransferase